MTEMTGGKDLKPLAVDNSNPIDDATERRDEENNNNNVCYPVLSEELWGTMYTSLGYMILRVPRYHSQIHIRGRLVLSDTAGNRWDSNPGLVRGRHLC